MLTEEIFASIQSQSATKTIAAASVPVVKDAGIFHLTLRPHFSQSAVFKKSSSRPCCVALSDNHVFAAQADKAVIHVYNREKGAQELTVPFGERVTALATGGDGGSWVVCGTESGSVLIWETYSGRVVKTQQSHVQAVTSIAVDKSSQYFLTGSLDSTVLIWTFASILSHSQTSDQAFSTSSSRTPVHTLTAHRAPITALAVGHSQSSSNFAISISEDRSMLIWHISQGVLLQTYLLPQIPRTLVLDPADRACYIGYDNGNIQLIDFYSQTSKSSILEQGSSTQSAIDVSALSAWPAPTDSKDEAPTINCMALSFDATRLLVGYSNGKIGSWAVGNGTFEGDVCTLPGAVTNIQPVNPLQRIGCSSVSHLVIKPKFDANISAESQRVTFSSMADQVRSQSKFSAALAYPGFPADLLWAGVLDLQAKNEEKSRQTNGKANEEEEEDFIALQDDKEQQGISEVEMLRQQVKSLQNTQRESFRIMRELRKERDGFLKDLGRT
ncbi:WD40 repeat-like protein [Microthyrium microscopicum]|uniref:Pre-rRNA-processing protein IPI3 n=1 Tax=Microthyrium microscopicum TaxID=703497 RepID=A0A6A6UTE2_9PEZI|nr:WD40 repeat-like protein [Microthyrium microscopicum]